MSPSVSKSDVKSEDHKKLVEAYNHSIEQYNEDYYSLSSDIDQNSEMLNDVDWMLSDMSTELSKIDSSLDVVHSELDSLGGKLEAVYDLFERQTAKMYLVSELQNSNLKKIIFNLQRPLDIKAKELRLRAIAAYVHGWYDESLVDFEKSLKYNQYDFTIHLFLGHIYYYENQDRVKALDHYQKAVKYALPYSKRYASFSSLYVSLMYRMNKEFGKAYTETKKAVKYSQKNLEAKYQHSINCVSANETEEAITILEHLVYDKQKDIHFIFNNEVLIKIKPNFVNLASGKLEILKDKQSSIIEPIVQQNIEDKKRIDDMMNLMNNSLYSEYYRTNTDFFRLFDILEKSDINKKGNRQQLNTIKNIIYKFYHKIKQDNPRLLKQENQKLLSPARLNNQNIIKIEKEIVILGKRKALWERKLLEKKQERLSEEKRISNRAGGLVHSLIHISDEPYRTASLKKISIEMGQCYQEISKWDYKIESLKNEKAKINTSIKKTIKDAESVYSKIHNLNQELIKLIPSEFISIEDVENEYWGFLINKIKEYSNILNTLTNEPLKTKAC